MKAAIAFVLAAVPFLLYSAPASAQIAPPTFLITEVHGMQHLVAEGDMLILIRYELPKTEWRDDTGADALMEEADCLEGNEANPIDLCWTSVLPGLASHTFYSGAQATATLVGQRNLPRIGHGLSALYVGTGHGLDFGSTTYESCVEGSATFFTPRPVACRTILWHTVTDVDGDNLFLDDAPIQNDNVFRDIMRNLQEEMPGRTEALLSNNLITPNGKLYIVEAYTNAEDAAPTAFGIARVAPVAVSLTSTAATVAESAIALEAQGSRMWNYVNDFNNNHLDGTISMGIVGGVFVGMLAMFIFAIVFAYLKSMFVAVIVVSLFIFGFGVLQDLFDYRLYVIVLLLMFGLGVFSYTRQKI